MHRIYKTLFFSFFLSLLIHTGVYAGSGGGGGGKGDPCGPCTCGVNCPAGCSKCKTYIPVDGGIGILVLLGAAFGAKKIHDSRKKSP